MLLRYLLPTWLLLSSLAAACQPALPPASPPPLGPAVVPGQPGRWAGPPAPPEQRITFQLIPFRQGGRYGLLTQQGRVVLPATLASLPKPVRYRSHVWAADAPPGAAGPRVLLTDSGRVLGYFEQVGPAGGRWGWVQGLTRRRTVTLFDSLGHLLRATPYGHLEEPTESLLVVALPDSVVPGHPAASREGLRGVIDQQAREVVPPRYQVLSRFEYGYAYMARRRDNTGPVHVGALDHRGREHWLGPVGEAAGLDYAGGFFSRYSNEKGAAMAMSVDGEVLIPYSAGLTSIGHTHTDSRARLLEVQARRPGGREGWGFYDSLFRPLLPPRYEKFSSSAGEWAVVDTFATPQDFQGFSRQGATWGGRLVVPTNGSATISPDCRFVIATNRRPGRRTTEWSVSERGGPPHVLAGYDDLRYLGHGVLAARQGERWGLVRADGQLLRPCRDEYQLSELQAGLYFGQGADSATPPLADSLGRVVLPAGPYGHARFFTADLAWVEQQGRYGIYSRGAGRFVVPFSFTKIPITLPDGSYWGPAEGSQVLVGHGADAPLAIADANFAPASIRWPYLVLGAYRNPVGPIGYRLYTRQGQLLSTEVTRLDDQFHDGVIWAANAAGRYALLDTQGRLLTPFRYQNYAPSFGGLAVARTADGAAVVVDCLGREYAW